MEQLTTIWKYKEEFSKWFRVTDVTISTSDAKLKELQKSNPETSFKISDKHPTKKPKNT